MKKPTQDSLNTLSARICLNCRLVKETMRLKVFFVLSSYCDATIYDVTHFSTLTVTPKYANFNNLKPTTHLHPLLRVCVWRVIRLLANAIWNQPFIQINLYYNICKSKGEKWGWPNVSNLAPMNKSLLKL